MTNSGPTLSLLTLCSLAVISTANAQGLGDCRAPQPPAIGVAVGRSSPYLELARDAVSVAPDASSSVSGGAQVAVRGDLPVAGPLRVRIEGAASHWDVREKLYDPASGYQPIADRSVASISARDFVALVGVRTGRPPACAHVSAGGGLYSINLGNTALHRTGIALSPESTCP